MNTPTAATAVTISGCLPTTSISSLVHNAQQQPMEMFDACPIDSVRAVCLQGLGKLKGIESKEMADWAERHLEGLSEGDPFWEPILFWYIEKSATKEIAAAAIEYAIQRMLRQHTGEWNKILPAIAAKLNMWRDQHASGSSRYFPLDDLYWHVPSMTRLMVRLISEVTREDVDESPRAYGTSSWRYAMTAINQITEARDFLMRKWVYRALDHQEKKMAGPRVERFNFRAHAVDDHLALLRARYASLVDEGIHQEQLPDFLDAAAQKISSGTKCPCRIECPSEAKAGEPMEVKLFVPFPETLTREVRDFLSKVEICHHLDGFAYKGEYPKSSRFHGFGEFTLELIARPGTNRLWIWFEGPGIDLFDSLQSKRAIYVFGT